MRVYAAAPDDLDLLDLTTARASELSEQRWRVLLQDQAVDIAEQVGRVLGLIK